MAYKLKSREEFNEYLKNVKIIPSEDEFLINEFNSSSLFELYELFVKIKDDFQISPAMQKKLKKHLQTSFPPEVSSCLSFPVNASNVQSLEEYIKDVFLAYVTKSNSFIYSDEEMDNLKIIMAKKYPNELMKFEKIKKCSSEIKLEQELINTTFSNIVDEYTRHSQNSQNNEDIQTVLYTTSKNEFSDINISTSARQKSPKSSIDNIRKEFMKKLQSIPPSNLRKGVTYEDLINGFNLSKVSDDYYGSTFYITGIDDTFHINKEIAKTKDGKEFLSCRKQKEDNLPLFHFLSDALDDRSYFLDFTQEEYLQLEIELLDRLQHMTFPECSEEYNGILFKPKNEKDIGTSFSKLLGAYLKEYQTHLKADDFNQNLSYKEHIEYQKELSSLLKEFKNHMNDKLEFAALGIIVPHILKDTNFLDENILRDKLDVKLLSCKQKANGRKGFRAIFAILQLPDNRRMELQFMSYSRFKDSKIGNFAHSKLDNKQIDISPFFELIDEFKGTKNYETMLENAIHTLDTTPLSEKRRLLSTPMHFLTEEQQIHKKDIEFAIKNLKIKENFEYEYIWREKQEDGSYATKTQIVVNTIEQILPMFAEYHSPKLVAISSTHSRFNKNIAFVNKKTAIDNFREVLLKTDETTCLADMLLNKLEEIQKADTSITLNESTLRKILQDNKISRDKIEFILSSALSQSQKIELPYTNDVTHIRKRQEEKQNER